MTAVPIPLSTVEDVADGTYVLVTEGNAPQLVTVRDGEVFDGLPFAGANHLAADMFRPVDARPAEAEEDPAYYGADRQPMVLTVAQ